MQCYLKLWAGGKVSRTFVVPFWQTMEYMREGSRIVYLFRLRSGSCMSSFAHLIAEEAGIPESTIKRALEVSPANNSLNHDNPGFAEAIVCIDGRNSAQPG